MIITAIIVLSAVVISYLMLVFAEIPVIPLEFVTYLESVFPYVVRGVRFINSFMYASVVMPLAVVCLALHSFWVYYRIAMWIIKKIPMLSVND